MEINKESAQRLQVYYELIEHYLQEEEHYECKPAYLDLTVLGFDEEPTAQEFMARFEAGLRQLANVDSTYAKPMLQILEQGKADSYSFEQRVASSVGKRERHESRCLPRVRRAGEKLVLEVRNGHEMGDNLFAGIIYQDRIKLPEARRALIPFRTNVNKHVLHENFRITARQFSQDQEDQGLQSFFDEWRIDPKMMLLREQCATAIAMVTGDDRLRQAWTIETVKDLLTNRIRNDLRAIRKVAESA